MIKDYTGSDESISSRIPMLLFGSVHDNCSAAAAATTIFILISAYS
jgi:hypothetical protein